MVVSVDELESTTFYGKRFTRKQLGLIQETVELFPHLSRRELGHTICEQLRWVTPKGTYKIQSCLKALEQMEARDLLRLPAKQTARQVQVQSRTVIWTERTAERPVCEGDVSALPGLRVELVSEAEEVSLCNEYIDRYHYLRYRRPIGSTLRYFIRGGSDGERLGCLSFSTSAVRALACRDAWIGWSSKQRAKRLNWVVTNTRFLIFPWVRLQGLASKSLSLAAQRIADDWESIHGYRPVLLETFVDGRRYHGTCYRAANWQCLGQTSGKAWTDSGHRDDLAPKAVYVYPLTASYREVLKQELPAPRKRPSQGRRRTGGVVDEQAAQALSSLWLKIMDVLLQAAADANALWRQRDRAIDSLLLILFIFRLVFSKNKQGYGTTLQELWEQCRRLHFPLPQPRPVAASAICIARQKLPSSVFKTLNTRILETYEGVVASPWKGHRVFAVDGTKIHLPPELINWGYLLPAPSCYPQGLVSCLYHLRSRIPYDFDLSPVASERRMALAHFAVLQPHDVVVYDRGYFSYEMLYRHVERGIEAVYRLSTNSYPAIDAFFESGEKEQWVSLLPSPTRQHEIHLECPDLVFRPLPLRLVKYVAGATTFVLGTTLTDSGKYPLEDLAELYHGRWGIEELYKISKTLIEVEDFHAKTEEGIKQELFAHFGIVTLSRLFTNDLEASLRPPDPEDALAGKKPAPPSPMSSASAARDYKVNFKNALITVARHVEALFVRHAGFVQETVRTILSSLSACKQKVRPHRSHKRQSNKPIRKWRPQLKTASART
jgi:hypothetical protein